MTSPIAGVWELVSDDEVGLFVVTETHFSDVTMKKDRKPWYLPMEREDVTDEMQIEAWNGLLYAISGTYEVLSANESECDILFHPLVDKNPFPSRDFSHPITLAADGNTMSGDMGPRHEVWRRVTGAG